MVDKEGATDWLLDRINNVYSMLVSKDEYKLVRVDETGWHFKKRNDNV